MADETKKPEDESQPAPEGRPAPEGSLEHDLFGDDESLEDELSGLGAEGEEPIGETPDQFGDDLRKIPTDPKGVKVPEDLQAGKPTTQMPAVTPEKEAEMRRELSGSSDFSEEVTLDAKNPVTLKYTGLHMKLSGQPCIGIFETADGVAYQLHAGEKGVMAGFEKRQDEEGIYIAQITPEGEEIRQFRSFAKSEELAAELERLRFEQDVISLEERVQTPDSDPAGEVKIEEPEYALEPTFYAYHKEAKRSVLFQLEEDGKTYKAINYGRALKFFTEVGETIEGRVQDITLTNPETGEKMTLYRSTDDQLAAASEPAAIPLNDRKEKPSEPQPSAPAPQTAEQKSTLEAEVAAEIPIAQPAPTVEPQSQYHAPELPEVDVPVASPVPPPTEVPPASPLPPPSQPEVEEIPLAATQPAKPQDTQYQPAAAKPAAPEAPMKPKPTETPAPAQPEPQAPASAQPEPAPQPVPPLETLAEEAPAAPEPQTQPTYQSPKMTPTKPKKNGRWKKLTAAATALTFVGIAAYQWGSDLINLCARQTDSYKNAQTELLQLKENERNTLCSQLAANLNSENIAKFDQYMENLIDAAGGKLGVVGPENICTVACYNELQRGDPTAKDVVVDMCVDRLHDTHPELMNRPAGRRQIDVYFSSKPKRGK